VNEYDPATHTYKINGEIVPSVTQVLNECGVVDTTWFTEESRTLGQHVHTACALFDTGDLDLPSLDPAIAPYVRAWASFMSQARFKIEMIETPLFNESLRCGGKPDRVGVWEGQFRAIVEIKTGGRRQWHCLQTAGYDDLCGAVRRFCVYLLDDGRFKVEEHERIQYHADHYIWRSCLSVAQWKRRHS